MRKTVGIVAASGLIIALSACASPSPTITDCPAPPTSGLGPATEGGDPGLMDDIAQETTRFGQDLIGMAEEKALECAEDAGYLWRVFERDGEQFALTMDYIPTRINVAISRGNITDAYSG
jgi:hypothetical protein